MELVPVVLLALVAAGPSSAMEPPPRRPPASPTPRTAPCTGPIAEYCGKCPTYAEALKRARESYCKARRVNLRVVVEDCVGGYHSISVSHQFGGDEYFDMKGNLIAAYQFSDVIGSYCNGASSSKTFGKIPTCSTEFMKIDFCKQ
jgi:hypothetical protein